MKNNSLSYYKILLVALISSLSITGIGFLDNYFWNTVFAIIGMIAYAIVGVLYSLHLITNKKDGKDAFIVVFVILIIIGIFIYQGIIKFQQWLVSWPLWIKIVIPSILLVGIISVIVLMILKKKRTD